ncbi:nucleotidyltransferase [Pantoea sp. SJZ147]|uniref:SMODS domain-containing nucleotidyltransferase n=1 Tax=Pantoea sp. SJZ147 TaxID=2572896 RepID=UPI0011A07CED|nr:nucleotidyltransferase [Pantoea sp. SJZ147]TWD31569.1 hypothetical protein FBY13_1257 [Pantoea sp. SJZ147]
MTVSTHLETIKNNAYQRDLTISNSISTLQRRLDSCFPGQLHSHFKFGSFTRDTMLPRSYDPTSDVDYMVVFNNVIYNPQTYLNKLKDFASRYYSTSELKQSHPTIQLSLNHITFELVPASYSIFYGYQIPSKNDLTGKWMSTDPNAFNSELTICNRNNSSMIKPLIRILKYWNANAGYVFDSYELEKTIVKFNFYWCSTLKDYFYTAVQQLPDFHYMQAWKQERISRLKTCISIAKHYEQQGNHFLAETEIKKLIP